MIHPISSLAQSRFVSFEALRDFVRIFDKETDDPCTNTWYADEIMDAFFAAGGKRLSHEEILARHKS